MSSGPDPAAAVAAVEQLLAAIRSGDAHAVWRSFAGDAQRYIVNRGISKGMAAGFGAAILDGTADPRERAHFIEDVLAGIHKDLERVDLDRVEVDGSADLLDDDAVKVRYVERFDVPVGPPLDPLPVGSVELIVEDGEWKVRKIVPRPG